MCRQSRDDQNCSDRWVTIPARVFGAQELRENLSKVNLSASRLFKYFANRNQFMFDKYHFAIWDKIYCASLHRRVILRYKKHPDSNTGWGWYIYLMQNACKFFHLRYKDGYMSNWRIQQCLYMKQNCGNHVYRWHTHQYLLALKKKEKARVSNFLFVYFVLFVFVSHFPQANYNPRHSKVEQITSWKYRKIVPVLSDFVVATYAFLDRFQLYNWP